MRRVIGQPLAVSDIARLLAGKGRPEDRELLPHSPVTSCELSVPITRIDMLTVDRE